MTLAVVVVLAGAAGAIVRYLLDEVVQRRWRGPFPMGIFAVNMSGALLLGGLAGHLSSHPYGATAIRAIAGIGFLGAYTTFSTLTYDTMRLAREGARAVAALNLLGSVVAGLGVAALGFAAGTRF